METRWWKHGQRVRKATDRGAFSLCSEQEQGRPSLLFRTDGASHQMTGRRQKHQKSSFHSIHQVSLLGNCSLSSIRQSAHRCNGGSERAGRITSIYRAEDGYVGSSPHSGRFKIEGRFLIIVYSLFGEINCFEN